MDRAKSAILKARKDGYTTAANNFQFYLNGDGGTKLESYDYLKKQQSFNIADQRLDGYLKTYALSMSKGVKANERKTFTTILAAQVYADNLFEPGFYYASGTSFIKANATITIEKNADGKPTITISAAKTWLDTYDFHKGLGVRFVDISDEEMVNLMDYGAKDFEMRSYYKTTLTFTGQYLKEYVDKRGISVVRQIWSTKSAVSEKATEHPDQSTTSGYRSNAPKSKRRI